VQGWWLCGDIPKTNVFNHRVPITDEVASVVQAVIDEVREKSTPDNNPRKLLFVRFDGKRKGRPPEGEQIKYALNRLGVCVSIAKLASYTTIYSSSRCIIPICCSLIC
jgi:integrase